MIHAPNDLGWFEIDLASWIPPSPLQRLQLIAASTSHLEVEWLEPIDLGSEVNIAYELALRAPDLAWSNITFDKDVSNYEFIGLEADTEYFLGARAVSKAGNF